MKSAVLRKHRRDARRRMHRVLYVRETAEDGTAEAQVKKRGALVPLHLGAPSASMQHTELLHSFNVLTQC
jgi:hypothetical protein